MWNQITTHGCRRGRGRGSEGPKMTGNNSVDFMAALECMAMAMQATAQILGHQDGNGNGRNGDNGPMILATFLKLMGEAQFWWLGILHLLQQDNVVIPWDSFQSEFYKKSFSNSVRTKKEIKLLQLKQVSMSVAEYISRFEELCRFSRICQDAPGNFEEWKCIKYEGRLRSNTLSTVGLMDIRTFSKLVNKSRVTEECSRKATLAEIENDYQGSYRKEQGKNLTPRSQSFKRNDYIPLRLQDQINYGRNYNHNGNRRGKHIWTYSDELRCFKCGLPEHKAIVCPHKMAQDAGQS
ncbi:uncharacterized protein LOC107479959 [Arachis duranensis]|uniref:Uncharacterized protein LOC107479959 n=1 Tax=Arachis duranensis TaxID=130453 RepID=A0A6P4CQE0_ARADU|nr:uncharacterized protein LOC107479959 [Arachis duranensis]